MHYTHRDTNLIFIYGALRSGTTLLRLMLLNHPSIQSPGEADYLFDYARPDPAYPGAWQVNTAMLADDWIFREAGIDLPQGIEGADLIFAMVGQLAARDQLPLTSLNIHRHAETMAALFPKAKIIHLLRDPRDVARSSVGMGWNGNSYYGIRHWLDTEASWDRASIPADQVLTIRFEEMMADLEVYLSRICDFLDLPFTPQMLDYHKSSTYGPPDPNIAGKWRKKAGKREIRRLDGLAGPIMETRGYVTAGDPLIPGALEATWLKIENTAYRWKFNIRRYGFRLFAGHHLARLLGLRKLEERLSARQHAIKLRHLK